MNTEYVIKGRKPERLFRFFEDICKIPRGSGNEEEIANYLVEFAKARSLEAHKDEFNNVLIRMPATGQYKNEPAVLLQGHIDMVCEKNSDVEHDFLKDPIRPYVDESGKMLRARGTTLGGDDGIAVAVMMAILDGELSEHPSLECLFTTNEEVGLTGAGGFDYSVLKARKMINMDSEKDGCVIVGCAGGVRSDIYGNAGTVAVPEGYKTLRISLTGLKGGHSGENINSGRANANKVMGRILSYLLADNTILLSEIVGGSKDNAIPRECTCVLCVENAKKVKKETEIISRVISAELSDEDAGFTVICEPCNNPSKAICTQASAALIRLLNVVQNGVITMSNDVKGLVEFSRNLGVISLSDGEFRIVFSSRSAIESQIDASIAQIDDVASLAKAASEGTAEFCTKHYSRYPGWKYAKVSPLRDSYMKVYKRLFGEEPVTEIIHAGLECGIISSKVPDMDIISIGPNMENIHSPAEALDLESSERFFETVKGILLDK